MVDKLSVGYFVIFSPIKNFKHVYKSNTPVTQIVGLTSIPNRYNYLKIFAFFIGCHR